MEKRKARVGYVVSDKMDKTVVVAVETLRWHPLYKKATKRSKKYKAHDGDNACRIGDKVKIVETRPLSKDKRWRIAEVISSRESTEAELAGMEQDDSGLH
jgi:small subunit ribosomal protein S17